MKLNQTARAFLSATLVGVACTGFIATAATSAQARDEAERPRHVVTAQRVQRPPVPPQPVPEPAPKPPVRQTENRQSNRPEPSDVSLDIEIRI
ncbi:MAG: hypothetical protein F6J95_026350 [Leptolyngbya sp. SIO1E4]|nr:hypothetical protein [Leptolyngbya sp. SIO1E4]